MKKFPFIIFIVLLVLSSMAIAQFDYRIIKSPIPEIQISLDEFATISNARIIEDLQPDETIGVAVYPDSDSTREVPPNEYREYFDDFDPNNTFFMSFLRYRGGQVFFREELKRDFQNDLPAYIYALKERYDR